VFARPTLLSLISLALITAGLIVAPQRERAQQQQEGAPQRPAIKPAPQPTPSAREDQEPIKVFTEEVRIPIFVTDNNGRFDPTIETSDVMVIEDDVQQEVRSVRHIPANVLLLLDTAGWNNPAMRTSTTRDIALNVVRRLHPKDQVSVMQFGDRVQVVQDWTTDTQAVTRAIKTKLNSGKRALFKEAMMEAAARLNNIPAGSRHLVLVTDGVEMSGKDKDPQFNTDYSEAIRQLINAQVTVHIISYTAIGRVAIKDPNAMIKTRSASDRARTAAQTATEMNPSMPNAMSGGPLATIEFDPAMRRIRQRYVEATKQSEKELATLAETTGGRLWLPASIEEMMTQAREVAREIGAQYVVTYTPKRPLASAPAGEYRRVRVALRRPDLYIRSRGGYTVTHAQ
jgi:VWFA-related protein